MAVVSPTIAYDRGYSYTTQAYVNYVQAVGSVRTTINLGQVLDLGGGAQARCVAVNGNGVPGASEENDLCAGLVVSYGGFDFFIGEICPGTTAEDTLTSRHPWHPPWGTSKS